MATVEEISRVRRRIGDSVKRTIQRFSGDGSETTFQLDFKNVFDVKVTINTVEIAPSEYVVSQESGLVLFTTAPAANDVIDVEASYAGYTDAMIVDLVQNYGVEGAIVEALQELLVDSARLYDYTQGQTTDKRSQVFDHLKDLLASAKADFVATSTNGVKLGRRQPMRAIRTSAPIDLSRDDTWSDNNV